MTALFLPTDSGGAPVEIGAWADALASMSPHAVLSYRSAAQLWGLWIPRFDGIEVTTPATSRGSSRTTGVQRRAVIAHRRLTDDGDITVQFGLPTYTIERTWLDLAAVLDLPDLIAAGDSALRAGADHAELIARAERMRGVRGAVAARRAVPLLDARSRSRPESRIRAGIVLSGLPKPEVNRPIFDADGGWLAEPDLHYRRAKLAIEFNGADHEGLAQMRKDSVRTRGLDRADWKILVYTAPHAFGRLREVADDVYRDLCRRDPELLVGCRLTRRPLFTRRVA
jgi:hypothetical protein